MASAVKKNRGGCICCRRTRKGSLRDRSKASKLVLDTAQTKGTAFSGRRGSVCSRSMLTGFETHRKAAGVLGRECSREGHRMDSGLMIRNLIFHSQDSGFEYSSPVLKFQLFLFKVQRAEKE